MGKKSASLGCFFWLAFILLVALLFFINKDNIGRVLEKTNALSLFKKKEAVEKENDEVDISEIQKEIQKIREEDENGDSSIEASIEKKADNNTEIKDQNTAKNNSEKEKTGSKPKQKENKPIKGQTDISQSGKEKNKNQQAVKLSETKKTENIKKEQKPAEKRSAKIYLVKIETDGKLVRKSVIREFVKTDSPLTDTIQSLLAGPTNEESKKGLRTFIPPDTKLISIEVKNNIAEINLSEDFQFNRYGIEAYQAQLSQIVFTACEYSTVDSVQFLIQGQKKEYLGAEGIWIGSPLSVNSF